MDIHVCLSPYMFVSFSVINFCWADFEVSLGLALDTEELGEPLRRILWVLIWNKPGFCTGTNFQYSKKPVRRVCPILKGLRSLNYNTHLYLFHCLYWHYIFLILLTLSNRLNISFLRTCFEIFPAVIFPSSCNSLKPPKCILSFHLYL